MTEKTTRAKILAAMYDLVAEKGYDKTSIGQLAEAIGIQKPSIYYYFKSKEDIFLQLVAQLYAEDFGTRSALLDPDLPPEDYRQELLSTGEAFIDSYFQHQTLRKVYAEIDLQSTRIPSLKDFIGESDRRFNAFLLRCIQRGVTMGAFPPDLDVPLTAQILYTTLVGIDQAILYDLPVNPQAVWRGVVSRLFLQ
ncbi:MAG: TetR/AcrR family transcriptional regulator [Oscillospiraceae bacterium]